MSFWSFDELATGIQCFLEEDSYLCVDLLHIFQQGNDTQTPIKTLINLPQGFKASGRKSKLAHVDLFRIFQENNDPKNIPQFGQYLSSG